MTATTNVRKGTNRPGAAARTAKAVQRTPLPETAEKFTETATAILSGQPARKRPGAKTPAKPAVAPKPTETAAAPAPERPAAKRASKAAPASPGASKVAAKTRATRRDVTVVSVDLPGAAKAQSFADFAAEAGWSVAVTVEPPTGIVVTASAAGTSIACRWVDGIVTQDTLPILARPDRRPVKLRNISAARKFIAAQPASPKRGRA
jgi:hypothetical protein